MNEFRRARRRKPSHKVEIIDSMTTQIVGQLGDLSETGMLLFASRPLISDALYQFRFRLTEASGATQTVEVGAHELWSDDAAAPGQIWTGLRFIDVSPSDLGFIRRWVAEPESDYT
jgi:c-di-GMP-binding flagellar brake protein YcgR